MAWRKEEEEVYDGWSTASCFAYSKYSKAAAFWGKTESTQYTDQWADLNTFQPARKKLPEGTKLMPELHLCSCRIPIYRIIRSWTLCMNWPMQTWDSHVTTVQLSTDGIFLQHGQKKLSFSGRNIWPKAWSPNSHYPVCPIIDERQSPEILSIHLLFWPNDIWRMW